MIPEKDLYRLVTDRVDHLCGRCMKVHVGRMTAFFDPSGYDEVCGYGSGASARAISKVRAIKKNDEKISLGMEQFEIFLAIGLLLRIGLFPRDFS